MSASAVPGGARFKWRAGAVAGMAQPQSVPASPPTAPSVASVPDHARERALSNRAWVAALAAIPLGILAALAVLDAHQAIDRPDPDTSTAARSLMLAVVGGVLAVVLPALVVRDRWAVPVLCAAAASVFGALWLTATFSDYGSSLGGLGLAVSFAWGGILFLLVLGILGLVQAFAPHARLGLGAMAVAACWLLSWGLAALFLLINLEGEAAEARAAYRESPGAGLAAVVALLGAAALARRRTASP